jgi:hypothetical protein
VTCVFTDTKRGTIIVEKQTDPNAAPDEFTFTGDAAGAISDGQQITVPNLLPGTYSSTEIVPAGWSLTSIVCSDANSSGNANTATFVLEAGETVTCTFTDTRRAKIVVDKVTAPGGDPTEFTFTPSGFNGDAPFMLADNTAPFESVALLPGSYSVTETVPAGWDLTAIVCDDGNSTVNLGTATATINLEAGETVTCTFTDTVVQVQAQLTVTKVVVIDNGGTKTVDDFPLFVDGQPVMSGVPVFLDAGTHTVSETESSLYAATFSGDCSAYGTVTLNAGDVKACTITNDDIAPKLIVIKKVVNKYGATKVASDFTMTVSGTAVPGGSTSFPGAESPGTMNELKVGSYAVTESGPGGYSSSFSSYCSGSISLGQTKTCTVTNTATNYVLYSKPTYVSFSGAAGTSIASKKVIVSDTTPRSLPLLSIVTDQPWLTVTPDSGATRPSTDPFRVTIGVITTGLAVGSYSGNVIVTSGTTAGGHTVNNSPFSIPVTLTITPPVPVSVTISPTTTSMYTNRTKQFTKTVSGTANTAVTWSASGGTISTSGLFTSPPTPGTYTVTATSQADPTKSASATVTVKPTSFVIYSNPTSVSFSGPVGASIATKQVMVNDTTPYYPLPLPSIVTDQPWLTVSPNSGTTLPNSAFHVTVGVVTDGLGIGTYYGNVIITGGVEPNGDTVINSPFSIPVTLTITP